ncbi:MAG: hypothetical protein AVDCRST_MAG02-4071, partial [uncultured Rubrobacteraceae bacterium]
GTCGFGTTFVFSGHPRGRLRDPLPGQAGPHGARRHGPAPDHSGRGLHRALHHQHSRAQHRQRDGQEHHLRVLSPPREHERSRHHGAPLLQARHKLYGPADGPPFGLGLLPERGAEHEGQGADAGHHHHLQVRGPQRGALRDRVDHKPAVARRERLLGLQGLRGRGAGPPGPGEGDGEDLGGTQRAKRSDKPATQRPAEL